MPVYNVKPQLEGQGGGTLGHTLRVKNVAPSTIDNLYVILCKYINNKLDIIVETITDNENTHTFDNVVAVNFYYSSSEAVISSTNEGVSLDITGVIIAFDSQYEIENPVMLLSNLFLNIEPRTQ